MTDTEKILEFDRIKEKLAELACTKKPDSRYRN